MTYNREERERYLEKLLEEATDGEEPLQKALTIIKLMRGALDEDKEWIIRVELDKDDVEDAPKFIVKRLK